MKRRGFLKMMGLAALAVVSSTVASAAQAVAKVKVYAKEGVLGFKKVAPTIAVKANKNCANCKFYQAKKGAIKEGLCSLAGMKSKMKSEEVWVQDSGYCSMWNKVVAKK